MPGGALNEHEPKAKHEASCCALMSGVSPAPPSVPSAPRCYEPSSRGGDQPPNPLVVARQTVGGAQNPKRAKCQEKHGGNDNEDYGEHNEQQVAASNAFLEKHRRLVPYSYIIIENGTVSNEACPYHIVGRGTSANALVKTGCLLAPQLFIGTAICLLAHHSTGTRLQYARVHGCTVFNNHTPFSKGWHTRLDNISNSSWCQLKRVLVVGAVS